MVVPASLLCGEEAGILAAPLDFEGCVDMLGGDRAMVLSLLKEFSGQLEIQMKAISGALLDANPDVVRKEAHSIKGGAAVLAAHSVLAAAAALLMCHCSCSLIL